MILHYIIDDCHGPDELFYECEPDLKHLDDDELIERYYHPRRDEDPARQTHKLNYV